MDDFVLYPNGIDLVWFAVDIDNVIVAFTSNGGNLPFPILSNNTDTLKMTEYVDFLPIKSINVGVNDKLDAVANLKSKKQRDNYLTTSIDLSHKGIVSFDKTEHNISDNKYHLVSYPIDAFLSLSDLPEEIQNIVKITKIPFSINDVNSVDIDGFDVSVLYESELINNPIKYLWGLIKYDNWTMKTTRLKFKKAENVNYELNIINRDTKE